MPQAISTQSYLQNDAPVGNVCGDADAGDTCFRLFPAPGCEAPLAYDIDLTAAVVVADTSITFNIVPPVGYPAISAANPYRLHAKDVLTFRTPAGVLVGTVTVSETKDFTAAAAQTVQIRPATVAIATTDVALAYLGYPIFGITNLQLQSQDTNVDTTKLKGGVQGEQSVTNRMLTVQIDFLTNQSDKGLWRALQPYSTLTTKNIFATIYMLPGMFAYVGMGNLTGFNLSAQSKEKVRGSVTFNAVAPYSQFPIRSEIQPTTRLAYHDAIAEYSLRALSTFA